MRCPWYAARAGGYYCIDCNDRYFGTWNGLLNHLENASFHNFCSTCHLDFDHPDVLEDHLVGVHFFCAWCNIYLDDQHDHDDHDEHFHYSCTVCSRVWFDAQALSKHCEAEHWYCRLCERAFQGHAQLKGHLTSAGHRGYDTDCIVGCGESFPGRTAMLLHLDADGCHSGITRHDVNDIIQGADHYDLVTLSRRRYVVQGPSRNAWHPETQRYHCQMCSQRFTTRAGLAQHLASPRHAPRLYKCPSLHDCSKAFSSISALVQHIDSAECGIELDQGIMERVDDLLEELACFHW